MIAIEMDVVALKNTEIEQLRQQLNATKQDRERLVTLIDRLQKESGALTDCVNAERRFVKELQRRLQRVQEAASGR